MKVTARRATQLMRLSGTLKLTKIYIARRLELQQQFQKYGLRLSLEVLCSRQSCSQVHTCGCNDPGGLHRTQQLKCLPQVFKDLPHGFRSSARQQSCLDRAQHTEHSRAAFVLLSPRQDKGAEQFLRCVVLDGPIQTVPDLRKSLRSQKEWPRPQLTNIAAR
jgi:hypothetical protein